MDRTASLLEGLSAALVPRVMEIHPPEPDPIVRFSVDDGLLDAATPTTPRGQSGPHMRSAAPIKSRDGRVSTGVWDCEAGVFEVTFTCDEVVHIVEGEVQVTTRSSVQMLREGDVAFFRNGLTTIWHVPYYVRKVWFHHNPRRGIVRRVMTKLRSVSRRLVEGGKRSH